MTGKYKRLGINVILIFIGNVGGKFIGFLMLPFYTRWLTTENYGLADTIGVYVGLLSGVATACIVEAIFVFPKGQPIEKQRVDFSSGLIFAFGSLTLSGVVFWIMYRGCMNNDVSNAFVDNSGYIFFLIATNFFQQYLQQFARSIDRIWVYSVAGIVLSASIAIGSFWAVPQFGVKGYVYVMGGANIVAAIYTAVAIGLTRYFSFEFVSLKSCIGMLRYSVPLIPNAIMWWLVSALNRPVMESSIGMHAIGIFAVAGKFPSILTIFFLVFASAWQISVLEEFGKPGYEIFYNKVFRMLMLVLVSIYFLFAGLSDLIVRLVAPSSYYDAAKYIPILVIGSVFSSISGFAGSNFSATRESRYFFLSSAWGALGSIVLIFILIPPYGVWGASIAVTASFAIMAIARISYSWKYVKIKHLFRYSLMFLSILVALYASAAFGSSFKKHIGVWGAFVICLLLNYDLRKELTNFVRLGFSRFKLSNI